MRSALPFACKSYSSEAEKPKQGEADATQAGDQPAGTGAQGGAAEVETGDSEEDVSQHNVEELLDQITEREKKIEDLATQVNRKLLCHASRPDYKLHGPDGPSMQEE